MDWASVKIVDCPPIKTLIWYKWSRTLYLNFHWISAYLQSASSCGMLLTMITNNFSKGTYHILILWSTVSACCRYLYSKLSSHSTITSPPTLCNKNKSCLIYKGSKHTVSVVYNSIKWTEYGSRIHLHNCLIYNLMTLYYFSFTL